MCTILALSTLSWAATPGRELATSSANCSSASKYYAFVCGIDRDTLRILTLAFLSGGVGPSGGWWGDCLGPEVPSWV